MLTTQILEIAHYAQEYSTCCIGPNNDGNGHLIYIVSTDQILVTMKYQSVPIPENLIKTINETDSSNNKIQGDHINNEDSIVQDDHSNNNKDDGRTQFKDNDSSVDKSHGELDSSKQLRDLKSNKIVNQENQILLSKESSNSTIASANTHTGLTSTSTPLPDYFLQYLHKTVVTILCLHHLCGNISTIIYLLSSL